MAISLQDAQLRDLEAELHRIKEAAMEVAVRRLSEIGEQAVIYARQSHPKDYTDRSKNLRSSIGYVVLREGRKVVGGVPFGTPEGTAAGRELLDKIAAQHPYGLVLIVVAGMRYAVYVEAREKDVLSGAELVAQRLVRKKMKPLKNMRP